MNKDQEDNLNMQQATSGVLHAFNAVWTANTPFSDAVDELDDGIDTIGEQRDIQLQDNTGVAEDKQLSREDLEDRTYTIGKVIAFYASTIKNRKLFEKVNYTRSELRNARDNEVPTLAQKVHEEAVANAAAILPYGVTGTMTTDLGTAKDSYVTAIGKPREALTESSAATERLVPIFDDQGVLLSERIDNGMELYRESNNDFYTQYFNARIIVNSPVTKIALTVHFEEEIGSAAIKHVNVLVDAGVKRRSSTLGNIIVQNLAEGAHTIAATLPGYLPVSEPFNVIAGETTKLVIKMKKV